MGMGSPASVMLVPFSSISAFTDSNCADILEEGKRRRRERESKYTRGEIEE